MRWTGGSHRTFPNRLGYTYSDDFSTLASSYVKSKLAHFSRFSFRPWIGATLAMLQPDDVRENSLGSKNFEELDLDKSGNLTANEILEHMDVDGNGVVSQDEFEDRKLEYRQKKKSKHLRHRGYGVNPLCWNLYKATQSCGNVMFLAFFVLFVLQLTNVAIDSNTTNPEALNMFYLNEYIKVKLIEQPFTDSDGIPTTTFMDIRNKEDLWIWFETVFAAYIAPSKATYEDQFVYDMHDEKPVVIDGLLQVRFPPEILQRRAMSPYAPWYQPLKDEFRLGRMKKNRTCTPSINDDYGCDECVKYQYVKSDPKNPQLGKQQLEKDCGCVSNGVFPFHMGKGPAIHGNDGKLTKANGHQMFLPINDGTDVFTLGSVDNVMGYSSFCTAQRLLYMKINRFIDQSTRDITISFCAVPFTADSETNPRLTAQSEASVCFRATFNINRFGLVAPRYEIFVGKTYTGDNLAQTEPAFLFVMIFFPAYLWCVELLELFVRKKNYFFRDEAIWNSLDVLIALLTILFGVNFKLSPFLTIADDDDDALALTIDALSTNVGYLKLAGVIAFLLTLRCIKIFSSISGDAKLPVLTIFRSLWDSRSFLLFLGMWTIGLALLFNLWFGGSIATFRSVASSIVAVLRMLLGDVDFDQFAGTALQDEGPVLVSIAAAMTLYFVLTMFVSIIDNAYHIVQESLEKTRASKKSRRPMKEDEVPWVGDYFYEYLMKFQWFRWLRQSSHELEDRLSKVTDELAHNMSNATLAKDDTVARIETKSLAANDTTNSSYVIEPTNNLEKML
jgi:hypothetical protein